VLYRSSGARDPDYSVRGPKDFAYIFLVTSRRAFPLYEDIDAIEEGLEHHYGCHSVPIAKLNPPIPIEQLREDDVLRQWKAYRASFVRAASPCPEPVWNRLMELALSGGPYARPARRRRPPREKTRSPKTVPESRRLEDRLEDWLADNLVVLHRHGWSLELVDTQVFCGDEHGGTMDRANGRTPARITSSLSSKQLRPGAMLRARCWDIWRGCVKTRR